PFWARDKNNWMTCIVGGLGIAGMALGDDHPQARDLVDYSMEKMTSYLEIYGDEGEFNESVAYANATIYPIAFFEAYRYYSGGTENRLDKAPFPETCEWMSYLTVPPGYIVPFGDSHLAQIPSVKFFAPVASASRNPFLQWFYLQHASTSTDPRQLVWYDASLRPQSPVDAWPLAKTYTGHGACFSSRTDWNQQETACAVYGKAGREENHEHNDAGQVCLDGYGERLIVDLGSPSGYPEDFFTKNRWKYYNASVSGHNVIQIGDAEFLTSDDARGRFLKTAADKTRGAVWQMDLSAVYANKASVHRTVVHLLPGIVVVLDDISLTKPELVQLRWHVAESCQPSPAGAFGFTSGKARLDGLVNEIGGEKSQLSLEKHAYHAPFNKDRINYPLEQRHEPFLKLQTSAQKCRFLSFFAVQSAAGDSSGWIFLENAWEIDTEFGQVVVEVSEKKIQVLNRDNGREWQVKL
ncbi:heparinase II/III family protein, partial [bacterium]|nr:heparinase II/III family protein [bacterium]